MKQSKDKNKSSRLRRFILDSLIVLGMSLVLVVLTEGFLRLFFPQNLVGKQIAGETFSNADEFLVMRYSPGSKWRFTHPEYTVEYEINEEGFRDRKDHPVPKPEGTIRVLLLGDSFTFGQGVNYDQSWPVIVEKYLEDSGNSEIDLVKAGVQGMDTRSEFILMKRLMNKYEFDVVVIVFLINDLYTNTLYGIEDSEKVLVSNALDGRGLQKKSEAAESWFKTAKQVFIRNDRDGSFHLLTLARRIAIANEYLYSKFYLQSARVKYLTFPLAPGPAEKLVITETLFKKIVGYCNSLGKKLIVLSIPQQFQVLYSNQSMDLPNIDIDFYDRYFSKIAEQSGFTWIAATDDFTRSRYKKKKLFYRLDGHLTPDGNQIVADVFLQEILPLIK
jgi:lysophospholipase L1-like esterase